MGILFSFFGFEMFGRKVGAWLVRKFEGGGVGVEARGKGGGSRVEVDYIEVVW